MFHTPMQMVAHTTLFSILFPIIPPAPNRCHVRTKEDEPALCSLLLPLCGGAAQQTRLLVGRLSPTRPFPWSLPFAPFWWYRPRSREFYWFSGSDKRYNEGSRMVRNISIVLHVILGKVKQQNWTLCQNWYAFACLLDRQILPLDIWSSCMPFSMTGRSWILAKVTNL